MLLKDTLFLPAYNPKAFFRTELSKIVLKMDLPLHFYFALPHFFDRLHLQSPMHRAQPAVPLPWLHSPQVGMTVVHATHWAIQLGPLFDIPTDIIFTILRRLPLIDVLSFGLTSRLCYNNVLPLLRRSIRVNRSSLSDFFFVASKEHFRADFIQDLRLFGTERNFLGAGWDVTSALKYLSPFMPNLHTLRICGCACVVGWDGLDGIAFLLGDRLRDLQVAMEPPFDDESSRLVSDDKYSTVIPLLILSLDNTDMGCA